MSSISTTDAGNSVKAPSPASTAVLVVALALPAAVLILGTAVLLLQLPFGIDPLWRAETLTLSEAAALHDNGEVVRLINAGENPNKATSVRADILGNRAIVITPLEAAVATDRVDMMQVLFDNGAVLDGAAWTRLMCVAIALDAGDARDLLEHRRPSHASDNCDHNKTPW